MFAGWVELVACVWIDYWLIDTTWSFGIFCVRGWRVPFRCGSRVDFVGGLAISLRILGLLLLGLISAAGLDVSG